MAISIYQQLLAGLIIAVLSCELGWCCMGGGSSNTGGNTGGGGDNRPVCTDAPTTRQTTQEQTTRRTTEERTTAERTTAKKKTTTRKPTTKKSKDDACEKLNCKFQGNTCKYNGRSNSGWTTQDGRLGNRDTGVLEPPSPGQKYAGTQVNAGEEAVLESDSYTLSDDRELEFLYWEDTDNLGLECCTDGSTCSKVSNVGVSPDDRQWKKGRCSLPKSSKKVKFNAKNTGDNLGNVGISDVRLVKPGGGDACTGGGNASGGGDGSSSGERRKKRKRSILRRLRAVA